MAIHKIFEMAGSRNTMTKDLKTHSQICMFHHYIHDASVTFAYY